MPAKDGGYQGIVIRDGKRSAVSEDEDRDRMLARLRNEAGKLHPDYFGFDGAIARFTSFFPSGFADTRYMEMERDYKLAAKATLTEAAPCEAVLAGTGYSLESIRKAFQTNMLSVFEAARISQVLKGKTAADFVAGAAKFTSGEIASGLAAMTRAILPYGRPSWPLVTYLPFFWRPDTHMYLKPEKTVDFATRVGHPFADQYSSDLEPQVYEALVDLAATTEREVAQLRPADRIDVQSFIWVVGDYSESELDPVKSHNPQS
jgi:hypothetical protein